VGRVVHLSLANLLLTRSPYPRPTKDERQSRHALRAVCPFPLAAECQFTEILRNVNVYGAISERCHFGLATATSTYLNDESNRFKMSGANLEYG